MLRLMKLWQAYRWERRSWAMCRPAPAGHTTRRSSVRSLRKSDDTEVLMEAVSLKKKLDSFTETWVPKVVGELNDQYVKIVKFVGEYVWHHHANEDELFLVIDGEIEIHFRDRVVKLKQGEFCIVPRG